MSMNMRNFLVAALLPVLCVHASTYEWTGAVSSDFATAGNWKDGTAPSSADADIHLVFPDRNSTVTGLGTLTVKTIVLQGGTTELQYGAAGGTFTVSDVISGSGALTMTGTTAANCTTVLKGANTFSGGYFNNGGRTDVYNGSALGTGPAAFKANGKPNYPLQVLGGCTIPNTITVGYEASAGIGSIYAGYDVTFAGAVTFTSDSQYRVASSYANYRLVCSSGRKMTFTGTVTVSGGTILPASANVRFVKPIASGTPATVSFNGGGLVEFAGAGNNVGTLEFNSWGSGQAIFRIASANPFLTPPLFCVTATRSAVGGTKMLDLNGYDVTLKALYVSGDYPLDTVATSASTATLTITGDNANRTYGGSFTGAMSLVYDCAGHTYTLTNSTSEMTGRLEVRAGTVIVTERAAFPNLAAVSVADGATLQFTSTAGTLAARLLTVGETGTLDLGGKSLEVKMLTVGGAVMPAGVYAAADCAWLAGSGSTVTVSSSGYDSAWWVWTGDAGGEWNVPGNWMKNGAVCTTAPGASDILCLDGVGAGNPFLVTSTTEIPNPIVLGAGRQTITTGSAAVTVRFNGVISGAGGIDFQGSSKGSVLRLAAANTFAGGVVRNGSGQVQLWHLEGLGTGAFTVKNPTSGTPVAPPMSFRASGTVTNDMTFLTEAQNGYAGCIGVSTPEIHLTGAITFDGDTRIAMNSGSKLYFEGETTVNGRLTHNNTAEIFFKTAVKSANGNGYLHGDQGHGTWHLTQTGNALMSVYIAGNSSDAQVLCEAENVFPTTAYVNYNMTEVHRHVFDLGGFAQTLSRLYDGATTPVGHEVTSASPATLTLCPTAEDNLTHVVFTGQASLDLQAAAGRTFTLAAANHTTRGTFRVSSGTLKLSAGAAATQLASIEVASDAKFLVDATAGIVAASSLVVAQGGIVEVGAGRIVSVDTASVAGAGLAAGTYSRANCDWVTGDGEIRVVVNGSDGLYVWTGEAGGEWNTPGNWTVNGAVATVAPPAGQALYIGAATEARPFRVTSAVEIANPIALGAGQQYIQLGFGDGILNLTGKITGSGGLHFDSLNNAQYYVRLQGAENDFVGGVRRSGAGQLQLFHAKAFGVGLVTLDSGSVMNSGIPNLAPLYVNESCTIANDFSVGGESFVSWNGWWGGKNGVTVHFSGKVSFDLPTSNYETRWAGVMTTHFDGPVCLGGDNVYTRLICKGGATAYFHQRIQALGTRRQLYADNGNFTGHLCASSNEISRLMGDGIASWNWYLEAPDALADADVVLNGQPTGSGFRLDLGGFAQNVRDLYYTGAYSDTFRITGVPGSALTVRTTENRLFGGRFEDAVSLTYAPAGDFAFSLSNAVHSTTGTVTVAGGTLLLKNGARFEKAAAATVTGGTLRLTEGNCLHRKLELRLDGGVLQLDAGTTTVANLYFGSSDQKQERGLWGAPGNGAAKYHDDRIRGEGLLNVLNTDSGTVVIFR